MHLEKKAYYSNEEAENNYQVAVLQKLISYFAKLYITTETLWPDVARTAAGDSGGAKRGQTTDLQPFVQSWKEFSSSSHLQSTGLGTGRKHALLGEEEFIKCCHAAKGKENIWC